MTDAQLHGLVTDIQVFTRGLSEQEAMGYTTCTRKLIGDLGRWEDTSIWETVGNVEETVVDYDTICNEDGSLETSVLLFPAWHTYGGEGGCSRLQKTSCIA